MVCVSWYIMRGRGEGKKEMVIYKVNPTCKSISSPKLPKICIQILKFAHSNA